MPVIIKAFDKDDKEIKKDLLFEEEYHPLMPGTISAIVKEQLLAYDRQWTKIVIEVV